MFRPYKSRKDAPPQVTSTQDEHDRLAAAETVVTYSPPPTTDDAPPPPSFGTGPPGSMTIEILPELPCPGHNGGTIRITYDIPSGVQNARHPHPGVPYDGTKRRSFLPNDPDGRRLLTRYKYAFGHGRMLSIGRSAAKGKDHQVTWSSLPNRTSLEGGAFGFPDPGYVDGANGELDKLGIPSADGVLEEKTLEDPDLLSLRALVVMPLLPPPMAVAAPAAAVVVDPPMKQSQQIQPQPPPFETSIVDAVNVVPIPPPYLIAAPSTHLSRVSTPNSWELSPKESKRCIIHKGAKAETKRLRQLDVPILASEIVIFIHAKQFDAVAPTSSNSSSLLDNLATLKVTRQPRALLLTSGTVQIKRLKTLVTLITSPFRRDLRDSNVTFCIFELRGVHPSRDVVMMAFQQEGEERCAVYQTPEPGRFLATLSMAAVAAYMCVPRWAVPIAWSGDSPLLLPAISEEMYRHWMGSDGGFSSSVNAATVAYHVQHKVKVSSRDGRVAVSGFVMEQQPRQPFPTPTPEFIDITALAEKLSSTTGMVDSLVEHGLRALAFNLVFRELKLANITKPSFRDALSRALLYNVTLRAVDFSSSNLRGFGEAMGKSWAMNAQPLISRINFSNCNLTGPDLNGLLPGLARIWCSGTAFVESIVLDNNPEIPTAAWDLFFEALCDPSVLPFWPHGSPPPPNLSFFQELSLRNTRAVGPGLIKLAESLKGLRSLRISSNGSGTAQVLNSLAVAKAPLVTFEGHNLSDSCDLALLSHCHTLKEIVFHGFSGDAGRLLCCWPPTTCRYLSIKFKGNLSRASCQRQDGTDGCSPASLSIKNHAGFGVKAINLLSFQASGLTELVLFKMHYSQLVDAAPMLACCGLQVLQVHLPKDSVIYPSCGVFWTTLATSQTLRDLQLEDQLRGNEIAMVGHFLKTNRSVQRLNFDSYQCTLDVDGVKILRSAFYGNKKVIDLKYPSKAHHHTMMAIGNETKRQLEEVRCCKAAIKQIFQNHYSYNPNWRAVPNRLKLPYVERIRVAKRRVGQMERDSVKIGTLLGEIKNCVARNASERSVIERGKENAKLARREGQLQQLAVKKKKVLVNLITKLNKAKLRGQENKSAKTQIPRSAYYRNRNIWPSSSRSSRNHPNSWYRYYNDPYLARYDNHHGYYGDSCDAARNQFLQDENTDMFCDTADLEPSCDFDSAVQGVDTCGAQQYAAWDNMMSQVKGLSPEPTDPWETMDTLIHHAGSNHGDILSQEYLSHIHSVASELGADVVSDISGTLDNGAAVTDKLEEISTSINVSNETLGAIVDTFLEADIDFTNYTLGDIPASDIKDQAFDDADDAVSMYAGAGPRDLDDGGPAFGGSRNAAVAGARRRARTRKDNKTMQHRRQHVNRCVRTGYKHLVLQGEVGISTFVENCWPEDVVGTWLDDARNQQVKAVAQSNIFAFPEVSDTTPSVLVNWVHAKQCHSFEIEVALVTQCSLDRLPNLEAQLASWAGKASVAVYLKPGESRLDAEQAIVLSINNAKDRAARTPNKNDALDVAVVVIEGCINEEEYPINYLRNAALLEARRQHLRFNDSLEKSALLLVDVDFRPSTNLYETLHSSSATQCILKQKRIVVCPAFECTEECNALSLTDLNDCINRGVAEGFHLSHFPQGHSPTRFDTFLHESLHCSEGNFEECWQRSYKVEYETFFEPYVVMASGKVPLYDERFQGYGLNKVSHLATIAKQKGSEFVVLPGVFLVAPAHERSESWIKRYGTQSDETKFNQLWLRGLYHTFLQGIEDGRGPAVSENTRLQQCHLLLQERELTTRQQNTRTHNHLSITQNHHLSTTYRSKSNMLMAKG